MVKGFYICEQAFKNRLAENVAPHRTAIRVGPDLENSGNLEANNNK